MHKTNLYNTEKFIDASLANPSVQGISMDVSITKDNKVVVFSTVSANNTNLQNLQNSNYENLEGNYYLSLESFLERYRGSKIKIIVNILPLITVELNDETLKAINERYEKYVLSVIQVLDKFKELDIYIASISDKVLYFLNRHAGAYKIGMVVTGTGVNYIDTDFYIFTTNIFNEAILSQQLKIGKEVMIAIADCNGMNDMLQIMKRKSSSDTLRRVLEEAYYINDYPEIFYELFQDTFPRFKY